MAMSVLFRHLTLATFAASPVLYSPAVAAQGRASSTVSSVENSPDQPSVIVLTTGRRFTTSLFEVKVLGSLRAVGKLPYLVLSGRGCTDCDANISIYIHSPGDGPMKDEATQPRYYYPGKEAYYEDGTLLYQARMFIGDCVDKYPNAVVWHQQTRTESGQFEASVFIVSGGLDSLTVTELRNSSPPLAETLGRVRSGLCKEVPGIDRSSEP